ncbi:MAG: hypothetical protein KDA64_13490 [Rhodospirillaceae bacterium]|nr:hypothetical protein [Rhodospirillaceae bacterium]
MSTGVGRRIAGPAVSILGALLAAGVVWLAYDQMALLRGLWILSELRYVLLACIVFAAFTLAERATGLIRRRWIDTDSPSH